MDEGETIEFFSGNDTFFFWNMDDSPVPDGTDLGSISRDIEDALPLMGFLGHTSIYADCKKLKSNEEEFVTAERAAYLPKCAQRFCRSDAVHTLDMTFYMLLLTENTAPERANVAVIAKPNSELDRVLQCLKTRGHKVLLVEPPPGEECPFSVDSLLNNSRLLGGGKPRRKKEFTPDELRHLYDCEEEEEEVDGIDDVSNLSNKILDFSERIRHVKGARTVIFWDAIDCPFPLCFSPDQIFKQIKSHLLEKKGVSDNITIWAYVDEQSWREKYRGLDKTWHSRIYFLPGGDKDARRIRMLNDMYLEWRDSPLRFCPGSLILVSDHFSVDPYYMHLFQCMKYRNYDPVLLVPSEHSNMSENPDEWPRSLFDRARKSSEGPLPKKPKLDAP